MYSMLILFNSSNVCASLVIYISTTLVPLKSMLTLLISVYPSEEPLASYEEDIPILPKRLENVDKLEPIVDFMLIYW